jgi:isopentenyl phosphate kinase
VITFLKLGGSLITEKDKARHARQATIRRLGMEIREAMEERPDLQIILGHGSGSFGHIPAHKFKTRDGVFSQDEWLGFAEVHHEAQSLNQIVMDIFFECGLPCIPISPLSAVEAENGIAEKWDIFPIIAALKNGMIPVVYGDTVFDIIRGGTILSTEDLFVFLAAKIKQPGRVLLAGWEEGLWEDFPDRTKLISRLEITNYPDQKNDFLKGSLFTDVTGGMAEKVHLMANLIQNDIIHSALIFSGEKPLNLKNALLDQIPGTLLYSNKKE